MTLTIREAGIGPKDRRHSSLFRQFLTISDGKLPGTPALKEHTTQTMADRVERARRPVLMTCARQPERRATLREVTPDLTGKIISHYRVVGKLGTGGMGVVYRAKDLWLHRHVALKFALTDGLTNQNLYECMLREARAGSALNHPNVCAVYEIGEFQGLPFLVMELLKGQTLKERIKWPLTLERFLDIAIQICYGLDAVHSRGIVHRDVKPSNIFITAAGHVKIFDFSLALRVNGLATSPDARNRGRTLRRAWCDPSGVFGTPVYMSPEQMLGEPVDRRTDLYSLGVVFHEMLTGDGPFKGANPSCTARPTTAGSLMAILALRLDAPSSLTQIVKKALEGNREFRFQNAADMCTDLKRIQRNLRVGGSR